MTDPDSNQVLATDDQTQLRARSAHRLVHSQLDLSLLYNRRCDRGILALIHPAHH